MSWVDLVGWLAAGFTLLAFSMKTMLPLRMAGIAANLCFILFGLMQGTMPILVLHLLLLPFNLFRLWQILRLSRRAQAARRGDFSLDWIPGLVPLRTYPDGQQVFRKGDPPDNLYYLHSGTVRLEEIGVTLGPGSLFGEIAFFTDAKARTLTARCEGPCRIAAIDERTFMDLYYRNPAFAIYVVRLVASRLLDGLARNPEAYRSDAPPVTSVL
jgi:hypothetical protein